jgi:hypothetical protein
MSVKNHDTSKCVPISRVPRRFPQVCSESVAVRDRYPHVQREAKVVYCPRYVLGVVAHCRAFAISPDVPGSLFQHRLVL